MGGRGIDFEIQGEMEKTLVIKDFWGWGVVFFFFPPPCPLNALFAAVGGLGILLLTNHRMTKVTWFCYLVLTWVEVAVMHPF